METLCRFCKIKPVRKNKEHCRSCVIRVKTWGIDGTTELFKLARENADIPIQEAVEFCHKYYIGKVKHSYEKAWIMKTAMIIIGWSGKIVGRHKMYDDYSHNRAAAFSYLQRNYDKKDSCEKCGSKEELHKHHIVPVKWGGVCFASNMVITLCKVCHLEIHKNLKVVLNNDYLMEILAMHWSEIVRRAESTVNFILR